MSEYRVLDGRKNSEILKSEIKQEISMLASMPKLVVVIVGGDTASKVYVNSMEKGCGSVGAEFDAFRLPEETTESDLLDLIGRLNIDRSVSGMIVQLPLPKHIEEGKILSSINPNKDLDGFHPHNAGLLMQNEGQLLPCTPAGVIELLKRENIEISAKHCVVIGRSNIVGKPVAILMLKENATVTIAHSKTQNLTELCKSADILIAAIGKPKFVKNDMVKDGAVVIDVGIHRIDGKLCGDVDFDNVAQKCSFITPVPGGVGSMTIAMLMKNLLIAYKKTNI